MTTVWGFGGVRFVYGQTDVEFTGAHGDIFFIPIQETIKNDDDDIISRLHGYNVEIETMYLYNLATDDYQKYQDLADILTQMVSSDAQNTVTIYPKYNDSYGNLSYECILDSDINLKDIARVEAGQVINLKWKAISKETDIPSLLHTSAETITDGSDAITDGTNDITDG